MKTDNSHLEEKLIIRQEVLNLTKKKNISILELYSGKGVLWKELKKRNAGLALHVFQIEKEKGKNPMALCGDNLKFLSSINLNRFDIIDVDAYGIPASQLEIIHAAGYSGFVIVTAIQSMYGSVPKKIIEANGITAEMYKKIPTLFSSNGFAYIKNFLYLCGVQKIRGFFDNRKYYFYYTTKKHTNE